MDEMEKMLFQFLIGMYGKEFVEMIDGDIWVSDDDMNRGYIISVKSMT